MRYSNVCLEAFAYELPPNIVTSAEIEERLSPLYERLSLPKGRLELMTGIRERRFWNPGTRSSQVAAAAAKKAIETSGVPVEKIGALFHASVCRDFMEPATASVEHHLLGLPESAMIFDISNACLGVLNGMITIANMIELGQIEAGVVTAGEMGESLVDSTVEALLKNVNSTRRSIKPAFASLTIGSGAVAVVLTRRDISATGHRLLGGTVKCATRHNKLCAGGTEVGADGNAALLMETDSEELLRAGCALAADTWKSFRCEMGWSDDDVARSFTHQVGAAHRRILYQSIGLDVGKDFSTVEFLGNVGSVSLPLTFAMGVESGVVRQGDNVALLGIGSGLNCMMLGVKW